LLATRHSAKLERVYRFGLVSLCLASALAIAQSGTITTVTTTAPTVSNVSTASPKTSAVSTSKLTVPALSSSKPSVAKTSLSQVSTSKLTVSAVTFSGGGSGPNHGGPLTDAEQALVDDASKDDLNWSKPGANTRQNLNASSSAQSDAATKTYAAAMDAGMDRSEAQRLAQAARQEVANGAPPKPPAAAAPAPAPAADALPEVIDLSTPGPAESTPPPGTAPSAGMP